MRKRSRAEARRAALDALDALALALALAVAGVVLGPRAGSAQRQGGGGYAWDDPDWHFALRSRSVKVVLLGGSIGAFQDEPYGRLLHLWCGNAEIRNLSRTGYGAYQLHQRFRREVYESRRVPFGVEGVELWLLWNGGLNSASDPGRTNHYIRRTFRDAHRRGMRVVGVTLTPWGSLADEARWGGARALHTYRATRQVVDFVLGRSSPRDALGEHAAQREVDADAPWEPSELADVTIDLYDSALRDREAPLRELGQMRDLLAADRRWRRATAPLGRAERETRLVADARTLAEIPRWFLRPELRAFDPVHPNRAGHRAMAELICPRLPASWACDCPGAPR